jgi:hypothetical protein
MAAVQPLRPGAQLSEVPTVRSQKRRIALRSLGRVAVLLNTAPPVTQGKALEGELAVAARKGRGTVEVGDAAAERLSRRVDNHKASIALHYTAYNFARIHKTLRVTLRWKRACLHRGGTMG